MPESPRWLIKMGRKEEGRFILGRLRGEDGEDVGKADAEYQDILNIVKLERETSSQQSYWAMFFGIGSGKLHTARRVQLVIWLQILQEYHLPSQNPRLILTGSRWIGIAGITIYGPVIFSIAGISAKDRLWVSGLNDITYMVGFISTYPGFGLITDFISYPLSFVCSRSTESAAGGRYIGARLEWGSAVSAPAVFHGQQIMLL